jgi:hypothetical protein
VRPIAHVAGDLVQKEALGSRCTQDGHRRAQNNRSTTAEPRTLEALEREPMQALERERSTTAERERLTAPEPRSAS